MYVRVLGFCTYAYIRVNTGFYMLAFICLIYLYLYTHVDLSLCLNVSVCVFVCLNGGH